jgi:triphosphoribosyl-dephospho-CoA synthase
MMSIALHQHSDTEARIVWAARRALYMEACVWPKPGLVSVIDDGSHKDMNLGHFIRSADSLDEYFRAMARAGGRGEPFRKLQRLGQAAEFRMLEVTGGVNVHRGAIFALGLLAAAAGWRMENDLPLSGASLGETVANRWGADIARSRPEDLESHGLMAGAPCNARDARAEAAAGFPTLFRRALPALIATLQASHCTRRSLIQALYAAMSELDDTNLLFRGGPEGLDYVQSGARRFLAAGGVMQPDWEVQVLSFHRACVERRLSPGGSADMLAAVWFVYLLQSE